MNMLQFPFLVLFDGDLCLESADAVRSAILTADAFGVVREKDESCVFVDQTRFNFICAEQDGKIKRRFISGLRGSIRLKNQLLFPEQSESTASSYSASRFAFLIFFRYFCGLVNDIPR